MSLVRRWLYIAMMKAIFFVTLVFLALFYFFDFSDEAAVRRFVPSYKLSSAALAALWQVPTHIYELLPITTLIGTIYVLSRLAQTGEFTIMRISGLGPFKMLRYILLFGILGAVFSFAIGDFVAPWAKQRMEQFKAQHGVPSDTEAGKTGTWLRDSMPGGNKRIINLRAYDVTTGMANDVTVLELSPTGQLQRYIQAGQAQFTLESGSNKLILQELTQVTLPKQGVMTPNLMPETLPAIVLDTSITEDMVVTSMLRPNRMSTVTLYQYMRHLEDNGQDASRYAIEFWRKVFYPISALVMAVLALPFAYVHPRSGSVALYVFIGVMLGLSFFLMNNVAGHLGYLNQWTPWLASATPGLIYSALSLFAFTRLVLRH